MAGTTRPGPGGTGIPPDVDIFVTTRRSPRYETSLLARVEGEATMREFRGNVSAGGFCFEADCTVEPGTWVELLFRLPGVGIWLEARGRVLGCEPRGSTTGVRGRFVTIDTGAAGCLDRWLVSMGREDDPSEITLYSTTVG